MPRDDKQIKEPIDCNVRFWVPELEGKEADEFCVLLMEKAEAALKAIIAGDCRFDRVTVLVNV